MPEYAANTNSLKRGTELFRNLVFIYFSWFRIIYSKQKWFCLVQGADSLLDNDCKHWEIIHIEGWPSTTQIYCIVSSAMSVLYFIFKSTTVVCNRSHWASDFAIPKTLFTVPSGTSYWFEVQYLAKQWEAAPLFKLHGQEKVLFTCLLQPPTHTPSPIPPPPASLCVLG
jgi:hypothetical protein